MGSGWYENKRLFPCERHHGGLVAVAGLMLEQDFFSLSNGPRIRAPSLASENVSLFYPPQPAKSLALPPIPNPPAQKYSPITQSLSDLSLSTKTDSSRLWAAPPSMPRYPFVKEPLKEEDAERFNGKPCFVVLCLIIY